MARYQIMYWKDIPSQVKADGEGGTHRAMLPDRFQQAIDMAAMAEGSTDTDAYLDGWTWGPRQERPGTAREVALAVAAELEAEYSEARLQKLTRVRRPAADAE